MKFQLVLDGVVQPIRGRSLNPIPSILRFNYLRHQFWIFNKDRRIDKLPQLSFSQWLKREGIDLDTYVSQDTYRDRNEVRLELYLSKGKFSNGKSTKPGKRYIVKKPRKPKEDFEQGLHDDYMEKTTDDGTPLHLIDQEKERRKI